MTAYSNDLRQRVVESIESGELSQAEAAAQFSVSLSFVEKLMHRWRTTQDWSARKGRPGPQRVLAAYADWLRAVVQAQPDLTLHEISAQLLESQQVRANHSMVWRELQWLKLPLKKSPSTTANATRRASRRSARTSIHG